MTFNDYEVPSYNVMIIFTSNANCKTDNIIQMITLTVSTLIYAVFTLCAYVAYCLLRLLNIDSLFLPQIDYNKKLAKVNE